MLQGLQLVRLILPIGVSEYAVVATVTPSDLLAHHRFVIIGLDHQGGAIKRLDCRVSEYIVALRSGCLRKCR